MKSPTSPRRGGFAPLRTRSLSPDRSPSPSPSRDHVVNIALTPIKTNTSDFTGARGLESRPDFGREDTHDGIFHKHRGRRRNRGLQTGGDASLVDDEGALTAMGRFYERVLNFSTVTRYLLYIIPLSLCFVTVILVGLYVAPGASIGGNDKHKGVRIVWFFLWLNVVWCSLWVSKLVAKALPIIFQALVGVVSSGVKKYALVIKAIEVPISLVGWAIASLCSFLPLMTRNPDQLASGDTAVREWQRRLNLVLIACLISSIVYLGEKLIIQIVSVDYHRKQFAQRIKTNKENVRFLSQLYEASRTLFPTYTEFAEEDYIINQSLASTLIVPPGKSGTATPIRSILGNINVVQDKVTSAFGNIAQEVTGNKNVFNPNSAYSVVINALQRKRSSEALARRIWMSFVVEDSTCLEREDLLEVMGSEHEQAALECFASLDTDGNGDVSLDEMVMHVVQIYNERKDVGKSMQDVDNAIRALDTVLSFIVFIIVIMVFVVCQQSSVGTTLAGAGTVLISLSFVFAITAQEILGSCIFLFVKHPFDVGDRVDIEDRRYVVEHINLLYTVFKCLDNQKITQVPNNVLNTKWIENISRSKHMTEFVKIGVNYDTSFEDITKLKEELMVFVHENSRDFHQDFEVEVVGVNDLDRLDLRLEIRHKSNWANEQLTLQRRNKFFCALVLILKKIPISGACGGGGPGVGEEGKPMYTVAISDELAQANMKKAAEAKAQKRWDAPPPTPSPEEEEEKKKSKEPGCLSPTEGTVHTGASYSAFVTSPAEEWRGRRGSAESRRDDVEEVRNLLKRASTRGRRRRAGAASERGGYAGSPPPPMPQLPLPQPAPPAVQSDCSRLQSTVPSQVVQKVGRTMVDCIGLQSTAVFQPRQSVHQQDWTTDCGLHKYTFWV